jgi:hypothetical protein
MSAFEMTVIALVAVWLVALTLVVLVLVRQTAVLSTRPALAGPMDGLMPGAAVPPAALAAAPEVGGAHGRIILTSATCGPCRELVGQLPMLATDVSTALLLPGPRQAADDLERLVPTWIRVIRDPAASALAQDLEVNRTPFVFALANGRIASKSYVRSLADVTKLDDDSVSASERPHVGHATTELEVSTNGR